MLHAVDPPIHWAKPGREQQVQVEVQRTGWFGRLLGRRNGRRIK